MHSLSVIRLFDSLDDDALTPLDNICTWRTYRTDEVIVSAGFNDRSEVFFVIEGTVRLAFHSPAVGEIAFVDYGAGDFFGELGALDKDSQPITAVALEDCSLAIMPYSAFLNAVVEHRVAGRKLLTHLATQVRLLSLPEGSAKRSDQQRVFSELLRLSNPSASDDGVWIIDELPAHQDIARACSAEEDSVPNAIAKLVRSGLARRHQGALFILDRGRLRQLAEAA